jgi:gliding motility-associated-like protein
VVTLSPGPQVAIQGDDTFCQGGSTVLTATGADTFLWSTGATTPDIEITVAGTYTVAGTNACGTVEAEVIVVIGNAPTVSITGDLLICPGQGTVLSATGSTGAVWSTGEQGSSITASTAGVYSVSVSNACGTATDEVEVAVTEVQAGATVDVTSGVAPLSVSFQHTGTTGAEIDWQFGDGATDSGTDPVHVFDDPGVYTVTQEVTVDGCTATATFIITVLELEGPPSSVIVPNVITPNGDGQNDFFQLISEGLAQVELTIFNRWGQVVARIEAPGLTWDAQTTAGDRVADGTYFYTLKAKGRDGVDHEGSGHITVLR